MLPGVTAADRFLVDANQLYVLTSGGTQHEVFAVDKATGGLRSYDATSFTMRGLAIDADSVFWLKISTTQLLQFRVAPKDGASSSLFTFDPRFGDVGAVSTALAGCNLYWTDGSAGVWTVIATPAGAAPHRLSAAGATTNHIAADDRYVYWTDATWIGRVSR